MTDRESALSLIIAEYQALKEEQSARITLRETALYFNVGIFLSFVAVIYSVNDGSHLSYFVLSSYVSSIMFWVYFNNDYYVNTIRLYIEADLFDIAKSIYTAPTADGDNSISSDEMQPFSWERSHRRAPKSWLHTPAKIFALFLSFSAPAIAGIGASTSMLHGDLWLKAIWFTAAIITILIVLGTLRLCFEGKTPRLPESERS